MNRHERRASAAMLKARRIGSNVVLDRSRSFDGKCDYCGKHGELRPYGASGEWICFGCAMKDEATTARRYREHVFGDRTH